MEKHQVSDEAGAETVAPANICGWKGLQSQIAEKGVFAAPREQRPGLRQLSDPQVKVVYLVPADAQYNSDYKRALNNAIIHLQRWYWDQIGAGWSFLLSPTVVDIITTPHPRNWYANNDNGTDEYSFWRNVVNDGMAATGAQWDDPNFRWVFVIDAKHGENQNGAAAAGAVAGIAGQTLEGLAGNDGTACFWTGVIGHELGHTLGLPHPPSCEVSEDPNDPVCQSLMMYGYFNYPDTSFLEEDIVTLKASPFIIPIFPPNNFECSQLA